MNKTCDKRDSLISCKGGFHQFDFKFLLALKYAFQ